MSGLRSFTYGEFEEATHCFSDEVGSGASSVVYKGMLKDDAETCIAVKKIDKVQQDTEKEFMNEVRGILLPGDRLAAVVRVREEWIVDVPHHRRCALEWFRNAGVTSKVDVYSFGVMLLEIICCGRNVELELGEAKEAILTDWANDSFHCGRLDLVVEGDEEAMADMRMVERFVKVAFWCLQEEPSMRPTMQKVIQMLDGAVAFPIPPECSSYLSSLQQ